MSTDQELLDRLQQPPPTVREIDAETRERLGPEHEAFIEWQVKALVYFCLAFTAMLIVAGSWGLEVIGAKTPFLRLGVGFLAVCLLAVSILMWRWTPYFAWRDLRKKHLSDVDTETLQEADE